MTKTRGPLPEYVLPSLEDLPPDPEAGIRKVYTKGPYDRQAGELKLSEVPTVVSYAEAIAAGVSPRLLRKMRSTQQVRGAVIVEARTQALNVPKFADVRWISTHAHARAVAKVNPTAIVDGRSAALLYGFPLPLSLGDGPLEMCVPRSGNLSMLKGVVTRRARKYEPTDWFGVRVNSYRNVVLGLAGRLSERDLIKLVDGLAGPFHGPRRAEVKEIANWLDSVSGRGVPGIRRLRNAVAEARDFVRSPMETEWRLLMVEAGFPEPRVNLEVDTGDGGYLEIDLAIVEFKIAVEYHGREYHLRSPQQIAHDNKRRLILERLGWKVIVITSERPVVEHLDEIRTELRARGWRG